MKASGLTFRLPTEEEWEYACRAGATGKFCKLADGTEITEDTLGRVAWFGDNSSDQPHPVGQKEPNAFGLYDMHGNVWEWTSSEEGYDSPLFGGSCIICGGGWHWRSAEHCESSYHERYSSDYRYYDFGFRLCADRRAD